jgi:hypothetical protein
MAPNPDGSSSQQSIFFYSITISTDLGNTINKYYVCLSGEMKNLINYHVAIVV